MRRREKEGDLPTSDSVLNAHSHWGQATSNQELASQAGSPMLYPGCTGTIPWLPGSKLEGGSNPELRWTLNLVIVAQNVSVPTNLSAAASGANPLSTLETLLLS